MLFFLLPINGPAAFHGMFLKFSIFLYGIGVYKMHYAETSVVINSKRETGRIPTSRKKRSEEEKRIRWKRVRRMDENGKERRGGKEKKGKEKEEDDQEASKGRLQEREKEGETCKGR